MKIHPDQLAVFVRAVLIFHEEGWTGTTSELLDELTAIVGDPPAWWPGSPSALSHRLNRIGDDLAAIGVSATQHAGTWTVQRTRPQPPRFHTGRADQYLILLGLLGSDIDPAEQDQVHTKIACMALHMVGEGPSDLATNLVDLLDALERDLGPSVPPSNLRAVDALRQLVPGTTSHQPAALATYDLGGMSGDEVDTVLVQLLGEGGPR